MAESKQACEPAATQY